MFDCPECGTSFDGLEAVAMHYINSQDGHNELQSKPVIKDVVRDNTGDDSDDSGEHDSRDPDGELKEPPFGEPEPGPEREPDPGPTDTGIMQLEPGQKVWVMEHGRVGRMEAEDGDYIDVDRGVLVDSDGSSEWVITTEPEGFTDE